MTLRPLMTAFAALTLLGLAGLLLVISLPVLDLLIDSLLNLED